MLLDVLYIIAGFALLAFGAGWLVDGGSSLARRFGVSPLIIGLTIVAWGTSMPEVVVSSYTAYQGKPAASLGNVLGSNVANIGLVLGSCAILLPAVLASRVSRRERVWLLGSLGALWWVCVDEQLGRPEAVMLLVAFGVYNVLLVQDARSERRAFKSAESSSSDESESRYPWLAVFGGGAAIAFGAHLVEGGSSGVATELGMSETLQGLTILALGTSLPELFAGIASARKGIPEIGLGNVVGSNVFNVLAVMGIAALIQPFEDPSTRAELAKSLASDFPIAMGFSLVLFVLPKLIRKPSSRLPGACLVAAYLAYMAWAVATKMTAGQ